MRTKPTRLDITAAHSLSERLSRTADAAADHEWARRLPLPAPVDDDAPRGAA